ncbi:hypothetical protein LLB_3435 [Legionella longbeachae D-4968]|nr:hypothetical protein LLB_3435 [Legionella longbeachae D-4968]
MLILNKYIEKIHQIEITVPRVSIIADEPFFATIKDKL